MTTNEALTQPIYKEEWEVKVDRTIFTLNEKQIAILKKAILDGQHGMVWFDKFAISIPHISSISLRSRERDQLKLNRPSAVISEEDNEAWESFKQKRKTFNNKFRRKI